MFKLFAFTLVFSALVYQTAFVEASDKDEAKNAFHKMMDAVDKALTQAQSELNNALNKVQAEATRIEGQAKDQLNKTLEPLREKLDDLVAKAKAKGFDVAKCQNYVDDFSHTPDNLVHNLLDCVTQQVQKAQGYVNDALNNAKQIEQDLNKVDGEIDNCGGNAFKKAKCYGKIIGQIAKDTKDAPQHIVEDVTKATALVTEIVTNLETCSVNELQKAGAQASEDVAKFGVCAAV